MSDLPGILKNADCDKSSMIGGKMITF